ncbi:RNA polymerase sigma-70 factor [Maribellus maritimus]|uniref:RNA polymerase sigma-70 factor n=1 Tax=Maribellus maritimus TaxID=2870838 RepID=UPI001EEA3BA5|nr:RNA polymerase sigma-70 factor [Maribellus maritimus]MCG6190087.1 RNA polymerase sigma-70 factor [Maribellus maritimus]
MKTSEREIIRGLKKGDENTYVYLFNEFYISLCAYSQKYVGRKDIAEEIVSDIFFSLWENRKKIKINTSLKSYLFKSVVNNSLYYLRKLEKENKLKEFFSDREVNNIEFSFSPEEVLEQSIIKSNVSDKIEEAVDRLPEQQKKAFKLKRFEGKKNKEIAEAMGLSIKTVEMHLSRATLKLREDLKNSLPDFLFFILFKSQ